MIPYNHTAIEKKWQARWEAEGEGVAHEDSKKEKSYLLVEFPYPSGAGLHTGHVRSYTAMDIVARKRRREGKNVLYPIGWDAFGLPTENYAIKTGKNPRDVTKENTDTFRRQLKMLGLSFDWSREINTTDPAYYKWTQWIFLQLFEKGLAYKAKTQINWCAKCKIGLANEEVVEGACERCGYSPVEKREKEQWMLKITEYAQRLYDDLDTVDYIERAKIQQRNWIGPSVRKDAEQTRNITETNDDLSAYNFILLHGFQGSPDADFFPWLKKELEQRGATVEVPALPNSSQPKEEDQVDYVLKHCTLNENTIMLGHSLGSTVALKVLEKLEKPIAGLITVGGFCRPHFKDKTRPFEKTFSWDFNWDVICKNSKWAQVLQDKNDPIISLEQADELSKNLEVRALLIDAQQPHFNNERESELLNIIFSSLVPSPYHLAPISVFTTRPDTLFGATYLVLAPEHKSIEQLKSHIENWDEVEVYIQKTKRKTDIERTAEGKEKSGVELKGVRAINPANKEEIPIWIADYVLGSYGTGAIMAVPAHDERDYAFASRINADRTRKNAEETRITIREVITPFEETKVKSVGAVIQTKNDEYIFQQRTKDASRSPGCLGCFGGKKEENEKVSETLRRELMEELELDIEKNSESIRYLYSVPSTSTPEKFLVMYLITGVDDSKLVLHEGERIEKIHDLQDLKKRYQLTPSLGVFEMTMLHSVYTGDGTVINSGPFNGLANEDAKAKIAEHVGGKMVTTYKLRDWVFSRQRYWGEPIPLIFCEHCKKSARTDAEQTQKNAEEIRNAGWVPVPETDLPVMLPEVAKYEPTDTGESPLANISEWVNTTCPKCGGMAKRETDVMPNWAGSSWYYLRYSDPQNKTALAGKEQLAYWTPVDWYNGGMEHTTLHLLYSRFWHKFLYDIGAVPTSEPYIKRTSHGLILAEDGEKMSKSKGNVVNPDEIVERFGADALRVYEMFMGPFDQAIAWSPDGLVGAKRFLERVYKLSHKIGESEPEKETVHLLHKTIKKVTEDIEALKMNTAISQLMILTNTLEKLPIVPFSSYQTLILLLAPFAPHLAEELWEKSGEHGSVHRVSWPVFDTALLTEEEVTIAVQVNGKLRGTLRMPRETSEKEITAQARALPVVLHALEGKEEKGTIFVPGKIINFRAE